MTKSGKNSACRTLPRKPVSDRFEQLLMRLSRHELKEYADFLNRFFVSAEILAFPWGQFPLGLYELPRRSGDAHTLPSQPSVSRGGHRRRQKAAILRLCPFGLTMAHMTAESVFWNRFSVNPVG